MSASELNYYGQPITAPEYHEGPHVANPGPAGLPPVCSCGWTPHEVDGRRFEMAEHLADMAIEASPMASCDLRHGPNRRHYRAIVRAVENRRVAP